VAYNGFVLTGADMTNTVDWLYTRLEIDGEVLDLATSKFSDFRRVLDLKTGVLTRTFVWETKSGKKVKLTFERFTSLVNTHLGGQKITFEPLNFSGDVKVVSGMDFSIHADEKPNNWNAPRKEKVGDVFAILGETKIGKRYLCATFRLEFDGTAPANLPLIQDELFAGTEFTLSLQQGKATSFRKLSVNYAGKVLGNAPDAWTKTFKVSKAVKIEKTDAPKDINETADVVWNKGIELAGKKTTYDSEIAAHKAFWANVWDKLDIVIEGDDENEPIADTVRGLLDGHIWLSRKLAAAGHYPAIDLPSSISRLMNDICEKKHIRTALELRAMVSLWREFQDLLAINAYKRGTNPALDAALEKKDAIVRFLRQNTDEPSTLNEAVLQMTRIIES